MIKQFLISILLFFFVIVGNAQDSSGSKITLTVNSKGDTLMSFPIADAKIMLIDLLDYEVVDSLLGSYIVKDSISNQQITLLKKEIELLQSRSANCKQQNTNLLEIIDNLELIGSKNEQIIIDQEKQIRKQKTLKIIAVVVGAVIEGLTIGLLLTR